MFLPNNLKRSDIINHYLSLRYVDICSLFSELIYLRDSVRYCCSFWNLNYNFILFHTNIAKIRTYLSHTYTNFLVWIIKFSANDPSKDYFQSLNPRIRRVAQQDIGTARWKDVWRSFVAPEEYGRRQKVNCFSFLR